MLLLRPLQYSGPAKSTPIMLKGGASLILKSDSGATLNGLNGSKSNFLHTKQLNNNLFTYCSPLVTENLARSSAKVALTLHWCTFRWQSITTRSVNLPFFGNIMGLFLLISNSESSNLPLQASMPFLFTSWSLYFLQSELSCKPFCAHLTHSISALSISSMCNLPTFVSFLASLFLKLLTNL